MGTFLPACISYSLIPKNPIVLMLEDCPVTAHLIERAILLELPHIRVLWARTLSEAGARIDGLPIDLFLVDVQLPDGSGLDFLWLMMQLYPSARAMVMTATPLPEYEAHSAALGVLNFFEKPLKMPVFLGLLREAFGATDAAVADHKFSATLRNVTPADIIQLKCLLRATTLIEVHSHGSSGRIRFEDGEIIDAAVGEIRGVPALAAIVSWRGGRVTEQPITAPGERTIHGSWQNLLMEAAQRLDESHAVPA